MTTHLERVSIFVTFFVRFRFGTPPFLPAPCGRPCLEIVVRLGVHLVCTYHCKNSSSCSLWWAAATTCEQIWNPWNIRQFPSQIDLAGSLSSVVTKCVDWLLKLATSLARGLGLHAAFRIWPGEESNFCALSQIASRLERATVVMPVSSGVRGRKCAGFLFHSLTSYIPSPFWCGDAGPQWSFLWTIYLHFAPNTGIPYRISIHLAWELPSLNSASAWCGYHVASQQAEEGVIPSTQLLFLISCKLTWWSPKIGFLEYTSNHCFCYYRCFVSLEPIEKWRDCFLKVTASFKVTPLNF